MMAWRPYNWNTIVQEEIAKTDLKFGPISGKAAICLDVGADAMGKAIVERIDRLLMKQSGVASMPLGFWEAVKQELGL